VKEGLSPGKSFLSWGALVEGYLHGQQSAISYQLSAISYQQKQGDIKYNPVLDRVDG
jgi:hypothetical protein